MDIKKQNASGKAQINNIGTQNNYYQTEPISKFLTVSPSKITKNQFLYRDTQIAELKAKITTGEKFALISGFGGIGKTAIARALYHELEESYEYVAWIEYNGSLKQSILDQFNLYSDDKDQDSRWKRIKIFLTERKDKLLFFADNIMQEADPNLPWLTSLKAHVVITARLPNILNFEPYEIEFLSEKQSIDVFYSYYKCDKNPDEEKTVSQLVDLVSCHTLSIELLAGVANTTKYKNNLKKILDGLQDKGFGLPDLKINSSHTPMDATILEHLAKLFVIVDLNDEQLRIIANFQIISKGLQVPCEFSDWIGCEPNALEDLVKARWISFLDSRYVMYDIVWEAIKLQPEKLFPRYIRFILRYFSLLEKLFPCHILLYKYAKKMIDKMVSGEYFDDNNGYLLSTKKIQIAESYAKYFPDRKTKKWSDFLNLLGTKYRDKGKCDEALKYHEKALGIQKTVLRKNHPKTAITYNNIGLVYNNKGKYDEALKYYKKALGIQEAVLRKKHSDTAITYNNMGLVYHNKGKYEKSLGYYEKALFIREQYYGKDHLVTASTYNNIAGLHEAKGAYEKALEYFEKALSIRERSLEKDHPDTATVYNNIGFVYQAKKEYEKALKYFENVLSIRERVFGKDHPSTAITYNNIACAYNEKGEYGKSLEYHEKSLSIRKKYLGKNHPKTAITYNNMGLMYQAKGEYDRALKYFEKALDIYETVLGKDHPDTATVYNNMGLMYQTKGEYDRALKYFQRAVVIRETVLGKEHPNTAKTYHNMALAYQATGEYDKALEYFQMALPIIETALGKEHPTYQTIKTDFESLQKQLQ